MKTLTRKSDGVKLYPTVLWENGEYKIETMKVKAQNLLDAVTFDGLKGFNPDALENFVDKIDKILESVVVYNGFAYLPYKEYAFTKKVLARYEEIKAGI